MIEKCYSDNEIAQVVEQAQREGCETLRCPHVVDEEQAACGGRVVVYDITGQPVDIDKDPKGARFGDHEDVRRASIECKTCGYAAAQISFVRNQSSGT